MTRGRAAYKHHPHTHPHAHRCRVSCMSESISATTLNKQHDLTDKAQSMNKSGFRDPFLATTRVSSARLARTNGRPPRLPGREQQLQRPSTSDPLCTATGLPGWGSECPHASAAPQSAGRSRAAAESRLPAPVPWPRRTRRRSARRRPCRRCPAAESAAGRE